MPDQKIYRSLHTAARIEGPIPVTAGSVPFCAMQNSRRPVRLENYGYAEEEFFASGTANVYRETEAGLETVHTDVPYKTRLIVRRPADPARFSGRVYFDILNATQNYDIEDLWHRIYIWCMEQGHGYIGITSKPVNAQSLKHYDYARYQSLDWSSPEAVPLPTPCIEGEIPGTEEGLIWDMIAQTAAAVRRGGCSVLFGGQKVDYLCLTGQSQSGFYLNTFVAHFDPYLRDAEGKDLFDGYMNMVGVPFERELRQGISHVRFSLKPRRRLKSRIPMIMVSSEGDASLFSGRMSGVWDDLPRDSDTPEDRCRYYEIAGAPHTDINCRILSSDEEVLRTGHMPIRVEPDRRMAVNDFPLAEYICGFLEKLYRWRVEGTAPEVSPRFERGADGTLLRDSFGNVRGGFRTPYVDIPLAVFRGFSDIPWGDIGGARVGLPKTAGAGLDPAAKLRRLREGLTKQQEEGWLTEGAVDRMVAAEAERYRQP